MLTIRRNDFIAFNAQLNEEINKKINSEKPEEKNKNIEKPIIHKEKILIPSNFQNLIVESLDKIKLDRYKEYLYIDERDEIEISGEKEKNNSEENNTKNEIIIDELTKERNKQSIKINELQIENEENKKDKENINIKYEDEKNNLLKEIQILENKNLELENKFKEEKNDHDKIKNELNELKKLLTEKESFKNDQKLNIMKYILEEKYINKLNEINNSIYNKLLEGIENRIKNIEKKYDNEYNKIMQKIIKKANNILGNSKPEDLPQPPGIRTSLQNQNIILNNNNINNNIGEKIYSYECLNLDKLISKIKEGTDETEVKIVLKNNGVIPWNEDTKLKVVESSDIIIDDIILKQQNPEEENTYTIMFMNLKNYGTKEYNTYFEFLSGGKKYGDNIIIKINIFNETEYNELEENS